MKLAKSEQGIKSVIAFYEIRGNGIAKSDFQKAWTRVVNESPKTISCRTVFHFDINVTELLNRVNELKESDDELLQDILDQHHHNGANFMFVSPVVGAPIDGFYLEYFLDKSNSPTFGL